jgi:sugar O-acyltransferase (sialic acid O-acetyltransferase NeuD family)
VTYDIVIIGTGGHAREVLDVLEAMNAESPRYRPLGFLDDAPERHGVEVRGLPVLGGLDWIHQRADGGLHYVLGIGAPAARRQVTGRLSGAGRAARPLVHPTSLVGRDVALGEGSVLTAGTILTTAIRVGRHVHLNLAATVSHDCELGDYATLAPGTHLAGNVRLGEGCEVGLGAVVLQGVAIGEWTVVGAGAVVNRALPSNATAVGVPARVIKQRPPGWHLA